MSNLSNSSFISRNSFNTLLYLSYFQLPFPPSKSSSSSPISKNKYSIIRKFFKSSPSFSIYSNKSFNLPSLKSLYSLQGKGRSSYLFTLHNLLRFERQIDVILLRSNLVSSIPQARLLLKNGLVFVNGRKLSSYYLIQFGDIITLNSTVPVSSLHVLPIPKYLIVNPSTRTILVTKFSILDIPFPLKFFHKFLFNLNFF